jgi:hypothetical protein
MAYEATKVFAIRKMKTQFTNKNTHILRRIRQNSIWQNSDGQKTAF